MMKRLKRLKPAVRLALHHVHMFVRDRWLKRRLQRQWQRHVRAATPAGPPAGDAVIVSLTSYPPRFPSLHWTLQSLLLQSHPHKRIMLWIAHGDMARLPPAVLELQRHGLEIMACDDTRSYKKLVPALQAHPDATIVTADDDIYYWKDWLRQLVDAAAAGGGKDIVAHRIHRIRHNPQGLPLPYPQWEIESRNGELSGLNFPTGNGGILYPAHVLDPAVTDQAAFRALCPSADDIWFYWMGRRNGARYRRVAGHHYVHDWQGSQASALSNDNVGDELNDRQIAAMIARYGYVNAAP